jgi:hypothetical protein
MIRAKPSIVEMNFINDSDNGNNVDRRCIRSDCIKKGSLYRTNMDTKEKGIQKIAYRWGYKIQEGK